MTIASPAKVTEEEPSHSGLDTGLHRSEKRDAMDKAEVNRLGRLLLLSFIGFFVTGWFLSRAFILTLFLLGGMVEVVYELALQRGMVGPRLPIIRTARYSAGLAIALVLVMYAMLRIVNLTH